ncbi:MAG: Hsp20/alpha crystallin family protein [Chloroflexi bacterium]|nr:Hsp20/alpha crystallin family protein [Chloroflexota bacterium]
MAIVRFSPHRHLSLAETFYPARNFLEDIDRVARDMWETWQPTACPTGLVPRIDMYEDKDVLTISMDLPGVKKEDITLSIEGDVLNIKAEKKSAEMSATATCYMGERCFGLYSRSVSLPFPIDFDKCSATFENGWLEIKLPKSEEVKARHIEVKVK